MEREDASLTNEAKSMGIGVIVGIAIFLSVFIGFPTLQAVVSFLGISPERVQGDPFPALLLLMGVVGFTGAVVFVFLGTLKTLASLTFRLAGLL